MNNTEFAYSAIFEARAVAAVVDTVLDEAVFLKSEDPTVPLDIPLCFTEYVRQFLARNWVHPDDIPLFDILLDLEKLRDAARTQKNGVLFSFRKQKDGNPRWARILLNVPEEYSQDRPQVLICLRYLSEREADENDAARTLSETIRKVVKFDCSTGSIRILKQPETEDHLRPRYSCISGSCWPDEEPFVHPEDLEEFRHVMNQERILEWFRAGNLGKDVFYRRKVNGLYRWVKLIIHPASDYSKEQPILIFYVVDVHRSMTFLNTAPSPTVTALAARSTSQQDDYLGNLLNALSFFTQQYRDFYIVDLKKDQYVKFKMDQPTINGLAPHIGSYSATASMPLAVADGEDLSRQISLEELRMILEDKVSFEYTFNLPNGKRYRTVCTRIEMENGVPTKMIAHTQEEKPENRLHIRTFGSFEVYDRQGNPIAFQKKKSKQLLAYLVDKHGFPVATADLVQDVLEKEPGDKNAIKYVSTLFRMAEKELEKAGYPGIILKEWNSLRVDVERIDCDYYHLLDGDLSYLSRYHNEYMKEYSWAEETNADILNTGNI